jgi:hypothetical protein
MGQRLVTMPTAREATAPAEPNQQREMNGTTHVGIP